MKKIWILGLLLVTAFVLNACASEEGPTTDELLERIADLESQLEDMDNRISDGIYEPGVYHGMAFANEGTTSGIPLDFDTVYTASAVVDRNGKIAGVFYDRFSFYTTPNADNGFLYRVNADLASVYGYEIDQAYAIWNDAETVADDLVDTSSKSGETGTLSQNDTFDILSGNVSRQTVSYDVDTNLWYTDVLLDSEIVRVTFEDFSLSIVPTVNVDIYQKSDAFNDIEITNEEKKAEALEHALDGYLLSPYTSNGETAYTYRETSTNAHLSSGAYFDLDTTEGRYVPGVYFKKIEPNFEDYRKRQDSYLVVVIDEYGNPAGSFINSIYTTPVAFDEALKVNDYGVSNIKVDKNLVSDLVGADYIGSQYDVYYEYDKIMEAGTETAYTVRTLGKTTNSVNIEGVYVDQSGLKFVPNGDYYDAYTYEPTLDENDQVQYDEDGYVIGTWILDETINFIYSEQILTPQTNINHYIPEIIFDFSYSEYFSDALVNDEYLNGHIGATQLYYLYFLEMVELKD